MGETNDDEHIWADLITPERAAKGDLDLTRHEATGYIRHARTQDRTVLGYLIDADKLDHLHRFYGEKFLECRHAFFSPVRSKTNALQIERDGEGSGFAAELYKRVCKRLGPARVRTVLYAMTEQEAPVTPASLRADVAVYREAFELLVEATDEERKRLYEELTNNACAQV